MWDTLDRLMAERAARQLAATSPKELARRQRFAKREARKLLPELERLEREEDRT